LETGFGGFFQTRILRRDFSRNPANFARYALARRLLYRWLKLVRRNAMNKHLMPGALVGTVCAAAITWVAAADTFAEGGFALLASVVFGLSAGVCIGGLIAANFAMLSLAGNERAAAPDSEVELRRAA
jgi:hypothetical protein